jgi:hypothetical protein
MSREAALSIVIGLAVLLIALMAWGWIRRSRRDAGLAAPHGELPEGATVLASFDGLYVATTAHERPLERLAIRGLAFRSRATIVVSDAGVALDLTGQSRVVLTVDRLVAVEQATVAIDRVVEKEGLTRISWRLREDLVVDTYLRPQDASAKALTDAIRPLLPASTATGEAA